MSKLLFDSKPLIIIPELACLIGLNEAIVLQQLNYWLQTNTQEKDGRKWVYNSITQWQEQFPFWSTDTVRRTLNSLIKRGLVLKGEYNKKSFDKTLWYTIDFEAFDILANSIIANCINTKADCINDYSKLHKPIPYTTTESTTYNKNNINIKKSDLFLEFYDLYPRKVNRKKAEQKYFALFKSLNKEKADKLHSEIMQGLKKYIEHIKANKTETSYIAHPTTWLNGERWADDYKVDKAVDDTPDFSQWQLPYD